MESKAAGARPRRIGLRAVAKAAGVCLMTASLSLRDNPAISQTTRERVRKIAEKIGYRPDPEIARLMGRLRSSRTKARSTVVALIDLQVDNAPIDHPYVIRLRNGIESHLDALGYGCDLLHLRSYGGDASRMLRVIRSRGINGCILLPSNQPFTFQPSLDWDGISVVAATTSVISPRFHSVTPNQIFNVMTLVEEMHRRGYSKIGLILSESLEKRAAHNHSLVLTWHGHRNRILILPGQGSRSEDERRIAAWLKHHRVDLILAQDAAVVVRAARAGKFGSKTHQVGLLSLSTIGTPGIAYQDERPEVIGESAVSILAGMMYNNETGIPRHPRITTIDGVFRDGVTVRPATVAGHDAS